MPHLLDDMMPEPNRETPPAPVNPYATPREDTSPTRVDLGAPLVIAWQLPWIGAGLGVLLQAFSVLALRSVRLESPVEVYANGIVAGYFFLSGMGVGVILDAMRQRQFRKLMPGHWVLATLFAMMLAQRAGDFWGEYASVFGGSPDLWYTIRTLFHNGLVLLFFIPIAWLTSEPWRWKIFAGLSVFFAVLALIEIPLVPFLESRIVAPLIAVSYMATTVGLFVLILVLLLAVVIEYALDKKRVKTRDGYHWLGIYGPFVMTMLITAAAAFE